MKETSLVILLLFVSTCINAQTQKGQNIEGVAFNNFCGISISMPNANTICVGASGNNGSSNASGQARVFVFNGTSWIQKGGNIDGEAADDASGRCVFMPDSNTIAIGAPLNDGNGISSGHVRIYAWDGNIWTQKGSDIDGELQGDWSGISVCMPDSNTVAIGAPYNNNPNGGDAGHVRVYNWTGSNWVQKGGDIDGETTNDYSGVSVSMPDINTVAIGANKNDGNGINSGHVRIYYWNGAAWIQKGSDINGESAEDDFGWRVSMPDPITLAVGAPTNDGNGTDAGHVRVFSFNGVNWIQKGNDIDGEDSLDYSGYSVSMPDSNTVAIGARGNDGNGYASGHVRIYNWNGNVWIQKGNDIDGESAGDEDGASVSMPNLNTIALGAPSSNNPNGNGAGQTRIFNQCSSNYSFLNISTCTDYTSPSGNYVWNTSGTYSDTITFASQCDSIFIINLTILTNPAVSISPTGATTFCYGDSVLLSEPNNYNAYQWIKSGITIFGANSNYYYAKNTGNFYCIATDQNGCSDTSNSIYVNVPCYPVGPNQQKTTIESDPYTLELYPNPTSQNITIKGPKGELIISNMIGKTLLEIKLIDILRVDLSEYPRGIYFINLYTSQGVTSKKLILE